jgi:uncharacterized damage-inducible protein DinB
MNKLALALALTAPGALTLSAQGPDLKTLSGGAQALHAQTKRAIVAAAEKMKAEDYGFAPTDGVRTFGQLVGHVADAQYTFCSAASGAENPAPGIEKSKTSKDDLVAALKEGMAYCDKVYSATTDTNVAEIVKFFGGERTRLNVLSFNTTHNYEHYGNMVTYMRIKGVVPPTSEGRAPAPPAKK